MRKSDLIAQIAQRVDVNKEQAQQLLDVILEQVVQAMGRKELIHLVGFGSFMPRHRGARAGKNPQTGESITIGACNTVAFKPGKNLREAVMNSEASAATQTARAPQPKPVRTPQATARTPRTAEQRV